MKFCFCMLMEIWRNNGISLEQTLATKSTYDIMFMLGYLCYCVAFMKNCPFQRSMRLENQRYYYYSSFWGCGGDVCGNNNNKTHFQYFDIVRC